MTNINSNTRCAAGCGTRVDALHMDDDGNCDACHNNMVKQYNAEVARYNSKIDAILQL